MRATLIIGTGALAIDGKVYPATTMVGGRLLITVGGKWYMYRPDYTRPWGYLLCRAYAVLPAWMFATA